MNMIDTELRKMDALIRVMTEWADWQKGYRMRLGYPSSSAGMGSGGIHSFDDLCDSVDHATMRTVDAVVQDLETIERAAILRRYGIAAVFRFPRGNYAEILDRAHGRLIVVLPRKGVWLG